MNVKVSLSNVNTEVKSLQMNRETISQAGPGDIVGFNISNNSVTDVGRGHIISDPANEPARQAKSFVAQIVVLNHPGAIQEGYTPVIHCDTKYVSCSFDKIMTKIDMRTGKTTEEFPKNIRSGEKLFKDYQLLAI